MLSNKSNKISECQKDIVSLKLNEQKYKFRLAGFPFDTLILIL